MGHVTPRYLAVAALCAYLAHTLGRLPPPSSPSLALLHRLAAAVLWEGAVSTTCLLPLLLRPTEAGARLLGKSSLTGTVPRWSHALHWPFHLYNQAHLRVAHFIRGQQGVPAATEVLPGWFLGGLFLNRVKASGDSGSGSGGPVVWAGIVDLTAEFTERGSCASPEDYFHFPCFDGCAPDFRRFEEVGAWLAAKAKGGPVVVHCAYGVGRSTTVLCAALVAAGHFGHWREAYAHVRSKRPVVNLNSRMKRALDLFQTDHAKRDV